MKKGTTLNPSPDLVILFQEAGNNSKETAVNEDYSENKHTDNGLEASFTTFDFSPSKETLQKWRKCTNSNWIQSIERQTESEF